MEPSGSAALTGAARISDPDAIVWCGDKALPTSEQGIGILGTPLGHPDCVRAELSLSSVKHDALMDNITHVQDLQCMVAVLLPEQTTISALGTLMCAPLSRPTTMRLCAVLCAAFSGWKHFLVLERGKFAAVLRRGLGLRSASLLS